MRIAILSDIHGNQVALEAVLEDLTSQPAVDFMVIAGDLCLNGPCPREVLEIIQSLHCPVIQGNVDVDVVTESPKKGTRKRSIVDWTREQIGPKGIDYLASLPTSHLIVNPDGSDLLVVHANPLNQDEAIAPTASDATLSHFFGDIPSTIGAVAFGHLHIAYMRYWNNILLFDAGSCGLPRDEDTRASYGILTWRNGAWHGEHHRVPYDIKAVIAQLKHSGIPLVEKRIKILTEAKY